MRGNPYYEPNYEDNYYNPRWYDRIQDPETWHFASNYAKRAARAAGPLLPIAAVAAPIMAVGYTAHQVRKAEDKRRREKLAREDQARDQLQQMISKFPLLMDREREKTYILPETPDFNALDDLLTGSVHSVSESPVTPPELPLYNIQLSQPILKKKVPVSTHTKYNEQGAVVIDALKRFGREQVMSDPTIRKNYPDMIEILDDMHYALSSGNAFPKPFLSLLSPETVAKYEALTAEGNRIKKAAKSTRKKAGMQALYPHRKVGKSVVAPLILRKMRHYIIR